MRQSFFLPILILVLALAACGPTTQDPNQPETSPAVSDESPIGDSTAAALAAREALAEHLGVDAGDIAVESTVVRDWPNSCLGLPESDELCAQVITPGYALELVYDNVEYDYRTNERGTVVRAE